MSSGAERTAAVPPARPSIDVVIVDFNAGALLRDCLASIAEHPPRHATLGRVVVVDNASLPPTVDVVGTHALPLEIVRNDRNRGFAAACNQGARGSRADYLLFLNPDTRLLDGSLDVPVQYMEDAANAQVGIAGIQLLDDDGTVARSCSYHPRPRFFLNKALGLDRLSAARFPTGMMGEWDHADTRRVDGVIGAFFFVRRPLFEQLGGFDERFFVYFEETDFGYRAEQAGFSTMYLTSAQAYHSGHGTTEKVRAHRLTYSMRSRMQYARRHFSAPGAAAVAALTLVVEPAVRVLHALARRSMTDLRETLRGYRMLWSGQGG